MCEYKIVMLCAIEAGLKGDTEALWVAKLLLTATLLSSTTVSSELEGIRH